MGVPGRPVRQLGNPLEAMHLIEAGRLEAVGHDPDGLAATQAGFGDGGLQQPASQALATMILADPELLDLSDAGPAVAGDGTCQPVARIHRNEGQSGPVIPAGRQPVVVVDAVLEMANSAADSWWNGRTRDGIRVIAVAPSATFGRPS